jgi:hypothetical protein
MIFFLFLSFGLKAENNLLVLEFKGEEHTTWHGEEVSAIACGLFGGTCSTEYTGSFSEESFRNSISEKIDNSFSINMSFSIFPPHAPRRDIRDLISGNTSRYDEDLKEYEAALRTFKEEKLFLEGLLKSHEDKLFVIAAGNGFALEAMTIPGMVLSEKYALYPSIMNFRNTIKVAALEAHQLEEDMSQMKLAYYSSFSTEYVDVAAPVPLNIKGEVQRGTSFAAPWVAGHLAAVKEQYPELPSHTLKKIMMRSVYIASLENTLAASLDYQLQGEKSLLYRAQHEENKNKRLEFVKQLGPGVLFVKSGGVLHPEVLKYCAGLVSEGAYSTIDEACLVALKEILGRTESELSLIRNIWFLRGL